MARGTRRAVRRDWVDTLVICFVAAVLRVWHLLDYANLPVFRVPVLDPAYHVEWATRLAEGGGGGESFFRAPLYPYMLATLKVLGFDLLWAPRWWQLGIGVLTVATTHRIAVEILPRRLAQAAGLLAAGLWLAIHTETELQLEALFTALVMLLLWLMVRAGRRQPSRPQALALGVASGLAAIARPNVLLFAPLAAAFAAGLRRRDQRGGAKSREVRKEALARLLVFTMGLVVPIMPVWLHNTRAGDPGTLIAWQGGINFYLGNNAAATGWSATVPGMRTDWIGGYQDAIRMAQEGRGRALRPSEVSDYWMERGLAFWRDEPGKAAALLWRKVRMFLSPWEIKNNEDPRWYRATLPSLRWLPTGWGLWLPLALLGLVVSCRRLGPERWLAAFFAVYGISVVVFFVCSRYRVPVLYLVPLFAMLAVGELVRWVRERRLRLLLPSVLCVACAYPLLAYEPPELSSGGFYQSYSTLGDAWAALGDADRAVIAYRRALQEHPGHVGSWNNLGLALEKLNRLPEAEEAYRKAVELQPAFFLGHMNLGEALKKQGKLVEAGTAYADALRLDSTAADVRAKYAAVLADQGRLPEAAAEYGRVLSEHPAWVQVRIALAEVLVSSGSSPSARQVLEAGLALSPGQPALLSKLREVSGATPAAPPPR